MERKEKTGLVMEGGAMRGLFSAGVADVFIEEGIEFDGLVGVSAGACFGCNVKSRQIGRTLRYNVKYCNDKRYCSFSNLLKTGDMFGVDFCYRQLPFELDVFDMKTFAENPMEFYVVCTDVKTGKAIYKKCEKADEEDLTYFRASASMPFVSTVVNAPDGSLLLDGGVSDSIPLEFFEKKGYSKNVVILTQPRGYVKGKNKLMPLIRWNLGKYPEMVKAVANRHLVYNAQTEYVYEAERQGRALVIAPEEKLPVGRVEHDPENLKKTYELGRRAALSRLGKIKEFIGTKG
jgi:predicted patatin/cPLA2 family phospholipase